MKNLTFRVPAMYADHHVLGVRGALANLAGVTRVMASAASRQVTIDCEDSVSPEEIEQALAKAGYSPGQEPALGQPTKHGEDGSSWYVLIERATETEVKDLEMAGDFRRY